MTHLDEYGMALIENVLTAKEVVDQRLNGNSGEEKRLEIERRRGLGVTISEEEKSVALFDLATRATVSCSFWTIQRYCRVVPHWRKSLPLFYRCSYERQQQRAHGVTPRSMASGATHGFSICWKCYVFDL